MEREGEEDQKRHIEDQWIRKWMRRTGHADQLESEREED